MDEYNENGQFGTTIHFEAEYKSSLRGQAKWEVLQCCHFSSHKGSDHEPMMWDTQKEADDAVMPLCRKVGVVYRLIKVIHKRSLAVMVVP